jgi:hypothetical protein
MEKFCCYHNLFEGYIELGCDGLSALDSAFEKGYNIFHDIPSNDLVAAILALRRKTTLTWQHRHVTGHQDWESVLLHSWATRNITMDALAKQHLSIARTLPRHFSISGEPWQIWIGTKKLTSNLQSQIYSFIHAKDGSQYWAAKPGCSPETVELVDWPAIGHTMQSLKRGRRVFMTKHMAGMCGVGKFMLQWKQWDKDHGPMCGKPEDAPHVWTCKNPGARDIWSKAIASIEISLRKLNTDPTIRHIIILYLTGWQTGEDILYNPPRALEAAVQEQNQIGWNQFFEGWLSSQWVIAQQHYSSVTKSNKTGRRWVIAIIQKLWDTAWDLWEHRNEVLHEKENLVTRAMGLHLNRRVTRVFLDLCSRPLRANDSHLVRLPLSKLLERKVSYKTQWLRVAEPALREDRHQAWQHGTRTTRMVSGMQRCMLSWLLWSGTS